MTKEQLATLLNGREYPLEMHDLEGQAKADGLIVIFGASDDLMEFRGAVHDEMGAYEGTTALVDAEGLLPSREEIKDDDELERFFHRRKTARKIKALWCAGPDYSWTYETDIPHAEFDIVEDGDKYCRGIVLALADLPVVVK